MCKKPVYQPVDSAGVWLIFDKTLRMKAIFLLAGICLLLVTGCKKSQDTGSSNSASASGFTFTEVKASVNPVQQSQLTNVSAVASGSNLSYAWSATHGDLFGSGAQVVYSTAPCCVGTHTVTCTVSNGSSSQSKSLVITVTN
jgi:hypothetical protein